MYEIAEIEETRISEAEVSPNRFTVMALAGVLFALLVACLLNEVGVFDVNRVEMWSCFGISAALCAIAALLVYGGNTVRLPATKYFLQFVVFLMTLLILVNLNISAILMLFLPLLISTRYKSMLVTGLSVASSCLCCVLYPLLAWSLDTWSLNIMTGYLETVCKVSIPALGASTMSLGDTIFNLLVYLSFPQIIVLLVFGSVFMGITRKNVQGLNDHLEVMGLTYQLEEEIGRVNAMQDDILVAMADLIESRDGDTGGHVKRIREVTGLISSSMMRDPACDRDESFFDMVNKAASLHDIGKISIDDSILRKPGKLTEEEHAIIRTHPTEGAFIIDKVLDGLESPEFICIAKNIALSHHERYDGTGYPAKLQGEDIPLEARIIAIADAYDAMVSDRRYRPSLSHREAFEIIEQDMGTHFDPGLNKYFLEAIPAIEALYLREN